MPTDELIVNIDGTRLDAAIMRLLSDIRVQQKLSFPSACELAFLTGHESEFYRDIRIGAELEIRIATPASGGVLFKGKITAREHVYNADEGPKVRIRAYDSLQRLRQHQPVRSYADIQIKSLASRLLNETGFRGAVKMTADVPKLRWQRLIQSGQNHFDFLKEQCVRHGIHFTLHDGQVSLLTLNGTNDRSSLALGETLIEAAVEVNSNQSTNKCTADSWDTKHAQVLIGSAARTHAGAEAEGRKSAKEAGSISEFRLPGDPVENITHSTALAQAELDRRAAGEVTLRGIAVGDPALRPGCRIDLSGVAREVAGNYVLTEATHVLSGEDGYTTEISTEPPPAQSRRSEATGIIPGMVTNVDDPEQLGRIKATLPAFDDAETDWMQVVVAGAGKSKGFVALPDVGDTVLLLCADQNPAHGIVLGCLYGSQPPPDSGVDGGKRRRFSMHTAGGHCVSLDDAENALRIDGSKGSYIEFSPSGVSLHAAGSLQIEAPGNAITLKGASIDFKTG